MNGIRDMNNDRQNPRRRRAVLRYVNPQQVIENRLRRFLRSDRDSSTLNFNLNISPNDAVEALVNLIPDRLDRGERFLLTAGGFHYTLSDFSLMNLQATINNVLMINGVPIGSDSEFSVALNNVNQFTITRLEQERQRVGGALFPFTVNSQALDLTEMAIFNDIKKDNYKECCLYIALKNGGLSEEKLLILRGLIFFENVTKQKLDYVCERLNIRINLKAINTKGEEDKIRYYPLKKSIRETITETYELGCVLNHYFINNKSKYTKYAIDNFDNIKTLKDWNYIVSVDKRTNNYRKDKSKTLSNFKLILHLLENHKEKFFTRISLSNEIMNTQFSERFVDINDLSYDPKMCSKDIKYTEPKQLTSGEEDSVIEFSIEDILKSCME